MKKVVLTVAVALGLAFSSNAQVKIGAEIGPWIGVAPTGAFSGFLINIKSRFGLSDNLFAGVNLGFIPTSFVTAIPLSGTLEYYLGTKGLKPFLGADAGYFLNTGGGAFLAPAGGLAYQVNDNIDITGRVSLPITFITGGPMISLPIAIGAMYKF